jgi:hypothetical protein
MIGTVGRSEKDPADESDPETRVGATNQPALDRVIQARIGYKLRAMYGELTEQPVPDRLSAILDRLGKD